MTDRNLFGRSTWVIAIAILLMAAGFAEAQSQDLSGVWEFQNPPNSIRMELKPDGTFVWNSVTDGQKSYFNGTWNYTNGNLHIVPVQTNAPEQFPVVWNGAQNITVTFNGTPVAMERVAILPTASGKKTSPTGGNQSLTGRWVFRGPGTEMIFLLMADRKFDLRIDQSGQKQHFTGSYNLENDQFRLRTDGVAGEEVYPLSFNGADSWTGIFNGNPVTFNREGTLPRTQTVEIQPAKENPKPKPKPKQTTPSEPANTEKPKETPADDPVEEPARDEPVTENPVTTEEPNAEENRPVFPRLRPRRPGDVAGNIAGNSNDSQNQGGGFLSGGGPALSTKVVGIWSSSGGDVQIKMELLKSGKFSYESKAGEATTNRKGTYEVKNNRLVFTGNDGQVFDLPFKMQGDDTITIDAGGTTYTMKRRQRGSQSSSSRSRQSSNSRTHDIVGTWKLTSPQIVITAVFNSDGSYRLEASAPGGGTPDPDAGTYTTENNLIHLKSESGPPENGSWKMPDRNTLTITIGDRPMTFQRVN